MNKNKKRIFTAALMLVLLLSLSLGAFAAGDEAAQVDGESLVLSKKAIAAAIAIAVAAAAGAIGMAIAISKSTESIARQPEAEGKIRTTLMLGLVFIETAIIYALIVAILIIFVL